MAKCRKLSNVSKGAKGQKTRGINGGLHANEKREGCDFKGRKWNPVKIQSPLCWEVWFLEGQSLPLVQDRRHQSRCRCCDRGCWLCPAAQWPEFCWGAGTQKGAGTQANRQKRHKMAILFLLQNRRCCFDCSPAVVSQLWVSFLGSWSGPAWQNGGSYLSFWSRIRRNAKKMGKKWCFIWTKCTKRLKLLPSYYIKTSGRYTFLTT